MLNCCVEGERTAVPRGKADGPTVNGVRGAAAVSIGTHGLSNTGTTDAILIIALMNTIIMFAYLSANSLYTHSMYVHPSHDKLYD
jgi:hypothetical protein